MNIYEHKYKAKLERAKKEYSKAVRSLKRTEYNPKKDWYKYNKYLDAYIVDWGTNFILSKAMVRSWNKIRDFKDIIQNIDVPIKLVCAKKEGARINAWKKALKQIPAATKLVLIKEASHDFVEYKVLEKLYIETLRWFNKK